MEQQMKNRAVIALDIGGTNIRMGLVSQSGDVIARSQSFCRIHEGLPVFLNDIQIEYENLLALAHKAGIELAAIGVGVPGLIDRSGTIISSVNLEPLETFNLGQWLESLSGLPAVVMNDANAAALAEFSYGAGQPFRSILHLTLGTGVGSGLIMNGTLWTGVDGTASEFGHVTVEPEGKTCQCGNRGCLEQYAAAPAIVRFAREQISAGAISSLTDNAPESFDTADVASAARSGDHLALDCFRQAGRYLGIACASAVNMLNLEAILVGGGVAESFDLLAAAIRKEIDARAFDLPAARVKLLKGDLGDNAGIMGAAAAAFFSLSSA